MRSSPHIKNKGIYLFALSLLVAGFVKTLDFNVVKNKINWHHNNNKDDEKQKKEHEKKH